MLSDDLRDKLRRKLSQDPKEAVKEIENNPQILNFLLDSEEQKIKYIKMNQELQTRLQDQANRLNVTQGLLIGAGLLFFLSLLDDR
jgi:murein L,D-transpeptidase YcbB/YkuD